MYLITNKDKLMLMQYSNTREETKKHAINKLNPLNFYLD